MTSGAASAGTRWHLQVASRYSCQSPSPNHWPTMSQLRDIHSRRNSWHGPRDRVPESANSVDNCVVVYFAGIFFLIDLSHVGTHV